MPISGTVYPSEYGGVNVGFETNSITHPYINGSTYTPTVAQPAGINLVGSKYESDPYPRCIVSNVWSYNM